MWEIINFCLLIVLLIIILTVILFTFVSYYRIKTYVDDAISHIGSYVPTFNPHEFTEDVLRYPEPTDINQIVNSIGGADGEYNNDLALFLCTVNMSSYNEYSGFDTHLKGLRLDETVDDVGYIFRTEGPAGHEGEDIIILSFRGTKTKDDIITDIDAIQCKMNEFKDKEILVHRGFYRAWTSYKDTLVKYVKKNITAKTKIFITGHSLGCSAAAFTALLLGSKFTPDVYLYMFAPPRIGNHHFINKLNEVIPHNYAIINTPDSIPNLPPVTLDALGTILLYDNFSHRIQMDYQLGSTSLNHRLDTYLCGLLENAADFEERCTVPLWKRETVIIT